MFFCSNDVFWLQCIKCKPLKCVSVNNQEGRVRPELINISSNKPLFYPYIVNLVVVAQQAFVGLEDVFNTSST